MQSNAQGDFALRRTGNYLDQIEGRGYHLTPITFHEFLSKPESLFMYDDSFMQIPAYIQGGAEIRPIEEEARQYVVQYIMDEFEHNLLGMQDYLRWSTLFRHKCESLAPSFWAQVNMHNLMMARELEMDENTFERTNTGNALQLGGMTTITDQAGKSTTVGKIESMQDIENKQTTDGSAREASASVVRAKDQITDDLEYPWSDAADGIRESRTRSGDTRQHMEGSTSSESTTDSESKSTSTSTSNNSQNQSTSIGTDKQTLTNKMFMQERQWAINTARDLLPLEWLRAALRPMFYMIY